MSLQRDTLEPETVYSLLANRVRGYLLSYLSATNRTTVPEAARRIANWQREATATTFESDRTAVLVQLIHNHLPRLSQYDIVEYDRTTEEITPGSNFEAVAPYVSDLEISVDHQ
ncbi:DUF7344 domain-containing protein [Natronorubrum tibetense]|uniref:DUF7344 domain-containing protein n=1 Tax=Natronorubrum tibetense GA33 TaxID=1114856 RepID=L9WAN5_9EURY|nr:hypothetical protein [Natronorubrum tibetense]ELY45383.1 hypothetical protein C496_03143 [Natronorubrum tibetense GA33]